MSSCRISHFGINPVKGGRPPRDRSTRGISEVSVGAFAQEVASVLIVVTRLSLKIRNVESVIIKYVRSVRSVSDGENWRMRIIQPRWAIDE